jgi:hypothetical protein
MVKDWRRFAVAGEVAVVHDWVVRSDFRGGDNDLRGPTVVELENSLARVQAGADGALSKFPLHFHPLDSAQALTFT